VPNSHRAATVGVSAAPVIRASGADLAVRGSALAGLGPSMTMRRSAGTLEAERNQVSPVSGQEMKMYVIGMSASSEVWFHPNCTNLIPYQTKEGEYQHQDHRDDSEQRIGARLQLRPEVALEMASIAHADHRTQLTIR